MARAATKINVYDVKMMAFHVANVFFEASIVLESRVHHVRALLEFLFSMLVVALPSIFSGPLIAPSPNAPSLSAVPSSIASASSSPRMLPSLESGVNGGIAAKAI